MAWEDLTILTRKKLTFYLILARIKRQKQTGFAMIKNIMKSLMTLVITSSAFLIGFYIGQEKIVSKIPDFQEDQE